MIPIIRPAFAIPKLPLEYDSGFASCAFLAFPENTIAKIPKTIPTNKHENTAERIPKINEITAPGAAGNLTLVFVSIIIFF